MADRLYELTAHELSDMIRAKQVSAREVAQCFVDRIDSVEDRVQSLEDRLTATQNTLRSLVKKLEEMQGADIDGDGKIG